MVFICRSSVISGPEKAKYSVAVLFVAAAEVYHSAASAFSLTRHTMALVPPRGLDAAAAAAKNRNMWMRRGTKEGDSGGLMRLTACGGAEALRPRRHSHDIEQDVRSAIGKERGKSEECVKSSEKRGGRRARPRLARRLSTLPPPLGESGFQRRQVTISHGGRRGGTGKPI